MGKVRTETSKWSDHFDIKKDNAICKKCLKKIKLTGRSTSGMKTHAKTHDIILDNAPPTLPVDNSQMKMDSFIQKPTAEELIAEEAANGISFRAIAKSKLMRAGMERYGYQNKAPKSHPAVSRLLKNSSENHRNDMKAKLKKDLKNGVRFCAITDEWTCPAKKRRYLNVTLHKKGMLIFLTYITYHTTVWQII